MEAIERHAIEDLLSAFAWHADRLEAQLLGGLFLPQGRLVMGDVELDGAAAIETYLSKRFEGTARITRHVWSDLRIEHQSSEEIASTMTQVTYEKAGDDQPTTARVSDVSDRFAKDVAGRWRFAQRIVKRVLAL